MTQPRYMNPIALGLIMVPLAISIAINQFKVTMNMAEIAQSVGMSAADSAWLMSVYTVIGVFMAIPCGIFVAKIGCKKMVLVAGGFAVVGALLGGFATTGTMLLASRAIEGFGFAFIGVAGPSLISTYLAPDKISAVFGFWCIWVPAGNVLAFNIVPRVYAQTQPDFSGIWWVCGALTLLFVLLVKFFIRPPSGVEIRTADSAAQKKKTLTDALRKKNLLLVSTAYGIFNFLLMIILTFVADSAALAGVAPALLTIVASMPMFCAFVTSTAIGSIAGRQKNYKFWFLLTLLAAGVGLVLAFTASIPLIWIGVVLFGVGLGNPGMALSAVGSLVDHDESLIGYGNGIMMTLQNLGSFLGTFLFPLFLNMTAGNYLLSALITVAFTIVGLICAFVAKWD